MGTVVSINPATGETIGKTPISTKQDIDRTVTKARQAFQTWRKTSFSERATYIRRLKKLLQEQKEELAKLTTLEMGKPYNEALGDVDWELEYLDYYAEKAEEILGEKVIKEDDHVIYKMVYEPWGVVASIAPWNFPISMTSSGITAQLMAGNTVVFKPSEYTTLTQKKFVDIFNETGLPEGVLQCVGGDGSVGKMLVDSNVDYVWFTGSTKVGQEIYRKCAEKFICCTLELGGSSPAVVFADCASDSMIETVFTARFFNCGQVCSAVKRLFVEQSVFDKTVDSLIKKVKQIKVGDPFDKQTTLGPLVSKKQLETLLAQVADAKTKGATCVIGGDRPSDPALADGYFLQPTIVTGITKDMRIYQEEVFGPVLPVMPFDTEAEAIALANDTPYGLTAEIFTKDGKKAQRVARAIDAGGISINGDIIYSPRCPIGGFKKSGIGREYGEEGFKELAQLKYVCVHK